MYIFNLIVNVNSREPSNPISHIFEKELEADHVFPSGTQIEYRGMIGKLTDSMYSITKNVFIMNVDFNLYFSDTVDNIRNQLLADLWVELT